MAHAICVIEVESTIGLNNNDQAQYPKMSPDTYLLAILLNLMKLTNEYEHIAMEIYKISLKKAL